MFSAKKKKIILRNGFWVFFFFPIFSPPKPREIPSCVAVSSRRAGVCAVIVYTVGHDNRVTVVRRPERIAFVFARRLGPPKRAGRVHTRARARAERNTSHTRSTHALAGSWRPVPRRRLTRYNIIIILLLRTTTTIIFAERPPRYPWTRTACHWPSGREGSKAPNGSVRSPPWWAPPRYRHCAGGWFLPRRHAVPVADVVTGGSSRRGRRERRRTHRSDRFPLSCAAVDFRSDIILSYSCPEETHTKRFFVRPVQ